MFEKNKLRLGGDVVFRSVEPLLRPKSIAIIGASDSSRGGWAQEIYDNLEYCGCPTKLYLINPKRDELWGRKVYPNFAAIPEPVDLALTIIPSPFIPDTLAEAAAHGLKCALIYAAQFGEGGDAEGKKRAQAAARAVGQAWAPHLRAELHGLAGAPRKAPALSGQARAHAAARFGRRRVPVRRHVPVLAAAGGAARARFLLCGVERQRARPRPRRLHQLHGRGRAHPDDRLPGRGRPAAASLHGGGREGARREEADPPGQGRPQRTRQGGDHEPHRRDRGRRPGVRRDVPEIRRGALPLARRPDRGVPCVRARPAAEGHPHRHGRLFRRRQGAWCWITPATKAPRWRR